MYLYQKIKNLKKQVILQQATNTYPNKLKNFSKRPFSLFFKSILLAEASLSLLTKFNPDKQISISEFKEKYGSDKYPKALFRVEI